MNELIASRNAYLTQAMHYRSHTPIYWNDKSKLSGISWVEGIAGGYTWILVWHESQGGRVHWRRNCLVDGGGSITSEAGTDGRRDWVIKYIIHILYPPYSNTKPTDFLPWVITSAQDIMRLLMGGALLLMLNGSTVGRELRLIQEASAITGARILRVMSNG